MKRQFATVARPFVAVIAPILVWTALVHARGMLITPRCIDHPESCTSDSVNPIDHVALGLEIGDADGFSYVTQNTAGVVAGVGILAADLFLAPTPAAGLLLAARDLAIAVQTAGWNGVGNELSHLATGRPRPFVYQDPAERGKDPAHYTSFWSGHTSFAAAAMTALLLCLRRRRAPVGWLVAAGIVGQTLVLSTAIFRIFAGRHFPTDVLAAAIAGSLVAYLVARANREPLPAAGPRLVT